jgi:signal transduction histidine kinase
MPASALLLALAAVAAIVIALLLWRVARLGAELKRARFSSARLQQREQEQMQQQQEQAQEQARFASMLSHEFRTPLTTIDGAIQRLEMTAGGADEATRKRYRKIGGAVERLLQLIDEYLSPERMAGLGRVRAADHCAPRALLEEAAAGAGPAQHPVSVRCENLPASLRCDPDGMRMCLQVLLDNALKYAPAGSPVELVGAAAPEGGVELLVLDRGPGIASDEMPLLFDKSFRGRNAIAQPGSGLGLYMARSVIEVHGGTLTARNRCAGGAAFRIWLPFPSDSGKSLASGGCKGNNS